MRLGLMLGVSAVAIIATGNLLTAAGQYLGGVAPYHWFDFVNDRALYASADVGGVSGATGYSFSRASAAYYTNSDGTLELFESGQLRMKRTADAGHNLLVRSQDFENASWSKNGTSVVGDALSAASTGMFKYLRQTVILSYAQTYTFAIDVKYNGAAQWVWLLGQTSGDTFFWFDIQNGVAGLSGSATGGPIAGQSYSSQITALGDGWFRCQITFTKTTATGSEEVGIGLADANGSASATIDQSVQIRNAQLNEGSSATAYVATTTTPVYAPRQGDRGVLIEGARTNLILRSQEFDNASWGKNAGGTGLAPTVTANAGPAPDGTTTADRLEFSCGGGTTSSDLSRAVQTLTIANTTAYASSYYLKSNDGNSYTVAIFDESNATATVVTVTPVWQRFTVVHTSSTTSGRMQIATRGDLTGQTADILIWGAQIEAAAFPSSYIPTTTASATRAADVLTCTLNGTEELAAAAAASPELVTNGGFDADASWTKGTGWTISGGKAVATATTGFADIRQTISISGGKSYYYSFDMVVNSGGVRINIGGGTNAATITTTGTHTGVLTATAAGNVAIVAYGGGGTFDGSIDNISVKEVPAEQTALYPLSLWAEFERAVDTGGASPENVVYLDTGSTNDRAVIRVESSDQIQCVTTSGGATQSAITIAGALAVGQVYKAALRVSTNSVQLCRGGTLGTEDVVAINPATPTTFRVGISPAATEHLFGYIRRAAIFSSALSDANLQSTTGS